MIIEGNVSVKAAVTAGRRSVTCIYVDERKQDKDTRWILHRAEDKNIPVKRVSREKIDEIASGRTHGGLIAETAGRIYQKEEDGLDGKNTFLCLIEGVEDPFNLGYIMRSLYSAGCTGLLMNHRDLTKVEPVILKSSAGAFDAMNIIMSEDLPKSIAFYKEKGIHTYAAMRKDAVSCFEADYTMPCLIAIGGEMRGLSSSVRKCIDQNIYIPYANDFHMALNAAGAAAVLGFEVYRQRTYVLPQNTK